MPINIDYENLAAGSAILYAFFEFVSFGRLAEKADRLQHEIVKKIDSVGDDLKITYKKEIADIEATKLLAPVAYIFNKSVGVPILKKTLAE